MESAIELSYRIADYLSENGFPEPITANSGNGGHLIYLLPNLPNTTEISELKARALKALSQIFNTPQITIDEKVFNAARIVKLYGTWARKGDSTNTRPHRRSHLDHVPAPLIPVTLERLQWLAEQGLQPETLLSPSQSEKGPSNGNPGRLDVETYLRRYGQEISRLKKESTRTIYGLKHCVFNPEHAQNDASIVQMADGKLLYQCFHNSCQGRTWQESRQIISGSDSLARFCEGVDPDRKREQVTREHKSAPDMGDLREYLDFCVVPGQKITADEICRGLSCYNREDRKAVYVYLGRLCKKEIFKKDDYRHGGYRRIIDIPAFDLDAGLAENEIYFKVKIPLELDNFIQMKPNQLLQISGRYDACKSSFLFHVMADNYQTNKIVHIVSDEWDMNAIKERMDTLGIPRPHPNIKSYPMRPGYEDLMPSGPCIVLIDYIRADQNPFETDAQIQRILRNLDGGVAIFATQKHPGLDRPVGGQFAVHASHHIIMLDKWKEYFTCKIYRTKSDRNLEGLYRTFKLNDQKRLYPVMDSWKQGTIKWDREQKSNDNNDNNDNSSGVVKPGGAPVYKEKERSKEKENEHPLCEPSNENDVFSISLNDQRR